MLDNGLTCSSHRDHPHFEKDDPRVNRLAILVSHVAVIALSNELHAKLSHLPEGVCDAAGLQLQRMFISAARSARNRPTLRGSFKSTYRQLRHFASDNQRCGIGLRQAACFLCSRLAATVAASTDSSDSIRHTKNKGHVGRVQTITLLKYVANF